jgi:hypothetical protein
MVLSERIVCFAHFGDFVMSAVNAPDSDWIDARTAAKILGVPGARNVLRLVRSRLIQTRNLPGVRAKYRRADVERLAAEGAKAPKPLDYLFDVQPQPGADGGLVMAFARYKSARDLRRPGPASLYPKSKKGEPVLDFGRAFEFLSHLGELAISQVNRMLDRDPAALLKAVDGPDRGDDGDWTVGAVTRFWEALARQPVEAGLVSEDAT